MSTETLEKPEVASEVVDRAEITGGVVLVEYNRTEAALAELAERYSGAKFDLTTTAGDKAARAARLELKTLRTSLEDRRKQFKAPALDFGRQVDAKAAAITAKIEALEKPIDEQIKADEARRAAEKAERERIEAERVAQHEANLSKIRAYVAMARDLPSSRIANGIAVVEAMTFGDEWQEFADRGAEAQRETLEALRALHERANAAEEAAAAAEAQRIEQARIAAEQAVEAKRLKDEADTLAAKQKAEEDRLAAERAEFDRQRAEFAAQQEAARLEREAKIKAEAEERAAAEAERLVERKRLDEESTAQRAAAAEAEAQRAPEPAMALAMPPAAASTSVPVRSEPPAEPGRVITTGQVCKWLGFDITGAVGFFKSLGIEPQAEGGKGTFWHESDLSAIRDALIVRLANLKAPQ